jgi:hypothetical protein
MMMKSLQRHEFFFFLFLLSTYESICPVVATKDLCITKYLTGNVFRPLVPLLEVLPNSLLPPCEVKQIPASEKDESFTEVGTDDCLNDFCKAVLTDGYSLQYKLNEQDGTITMELTYFGNAWVGIAFTKNAGQMAGSDAVM